MISLKHDHGLFHFLVFGNQTELREDGVTGAHTAFAANPVGEVHNFVQEAAPVRLRQTAACLVSALQPRAQTAIPKDALVKEFIYHYFTMYIVKIS